MSIQGEPWSQIGRISPHLPPHLTPEQRLCLEKERKKEREGGG